MRWSGLSRRRRTRSTSSAINRPDSFPGRRRRSYETPSLAGTRSTRRSRGSRRPSRKSLSRRQLFERELGNFRRVFNPQPANRNDLLGDKLRDGVAAILQTQRTLALFVSRHQTFNVLGLEHSVLYQLVNSHRFLQRAAARFRRSLKLRGP